MSEGHVKRFQFTLRKLLGAMTAIAVSVAIAVWLWKGFEQGWEAQQRRRLREAFLRGALPPSELAKVPYDGILSDQEVETIRRAYEDRWAESQNPD